MLFEGCESAKTNRPPFLRQYRFSSVLLLFATLLLTAMPALPQFSVRQGDEPSIKAILYHKDNPRALVYHNNRRFHLVDQMRLDNEWYVEEIRRESILFKKTSTRTYAEIFLNPPRKSNFHRGWSFCGHPISLWQAIELLAHHGGTISKIFEKIIPPHHRFAIEGPMFMVLPVKPAGEEWTEVLHRMKKCNPERLALRYPGLNNAGIIFSRGDDIQFVLRKISLGGKTPIQFPRDLHFPVYCTFRNIPFCKMLASIVYLNQCIIIEREEGLEITPWPRQILQQRPYPDFPLIRVDPYEPQPGTGPTPPPLVPSHLYNHPIVNQNPD
jgi:hypothetical protein